jgi:hypothetical protein
MKLIIEKDRGRLYFDPETGYLRFDCGGMGMAIELSDSERKKLIKALWPECRQSARP